MDITAIATQEFIEVDADERLGKVRSLFDGHNPKGIVVTNGEGYAGVITQQHLLQSHIEDYTRASAMMKPAPRVERTNDIRDVARMLVEADAKIAPVFEGDELWGIVTNDDILTAVLDSLDAITVGDIYTADPVTITEATTFGRIVNLLREHGISRLPVVDDSSHLAGIVTTRDLVEMVVRNMDKATRGDRAGESDRILDLPAYDLMSGPVETTTVEATVEEAVRTMLDRDFAGLVVVDPGDDRRVAGVVTKTDVLRALSYTEEERMDVQITNISLLDTIPREEIQESIEAIASKYSDMHVLHAHVRFHKHKEKLRGTPLIQSQIRLRTDRGQVAGSGEGYGAESAFYVALDTLERNVLEMKGVQSDEEYRGQLLRKLGEL